MNLTYPQVHQAHLQSGMSTQFPVGAFSDHMKINLKENQDQSFVVRGVQATRESRGSTDDRNRQSRQVKNRTDNLINRSVSVSLLQTGKNSDINTQSSNTAAGEDNNSGDFDTRF